MDSVKSRFETFELTMTETKDNFNKLKDASNSIDSVFGTLDLTIKKLGGFYDDFIKTSNGELYIFGLDSFNFQNKLIHLDIENMKKIRKMLFNRMYADYYKMYNIIVTYVKNNLKNTKLYNALISSNKSFQKYNYLDIYKDYKFSLSNDVFYEIINIMTQLYDHCKLLISQIQDYERKQEIGLHINNFVYAHKYRLTSIKTQLNLYMSYIEFFIGIHTKYLQRFITRLKVMYFQIVDDIKFDDLTEKYPAKKDVLQEGIQKNTPHPMSTMKSFGSSKSINHLNVDITNKHRNIVDTESSMNNVIVDGGVIIKPELSPKEQSDIKNLLKNVQDEDSELARVGLQDLIDSTCTMSDVEIELAVMPKGETVVSDVTPSLVESDDTDDTDDSDLENGEKSSEEGDDASDEQIKEESNVEDSINSERKQSVDSDTELISEVVTNVLDECVSGISDS